MSGLNPVYLVISILGILATVYSVVIYAKAAKEVALGKAERELINTLKEQNDAQEKQIDNLQRQNNNQARELLRLHSAVYQSEGGEQEYARIN